MTLREQRRGTRRLIGFRIGGNRVSEAANALMGEFPAECTFYIPEEHHKRLIGYGGQTIQALMKKYGVYVKFVSHNGRPRMAASVSTRER